MQQPILIIDADEDHCAELRSILEKHQRSTVCFDSIINLEDLLDRTGCRVLIIDLDTLPVDNRVFRELKRRNPELGIIALSARLFHPELKEAMAGHIYACLNKPVDPDELRYWVKAILGDVQ